MCSHTCCTWILYFIIATSFVGQVLSVEAVNSGAGLPCSGLKHELIGHNDVVVCDASWTGDINAASDICRNVWHLCTWSDADVLSKISWYEATHISGCYAINAAHNGHTCSDCGGKSRDAEMAAIGADCIGYNESSSSCFGGGRIDASATYVPQYTPCHHAPWISGVLCCRNKAGDTKPKIIAHPDKNVNVFVGATVMLGCEATGEPQPNYTWFKNGVLVKNDDHIIRAVSDGSLVLISVTAQDKGYWQCLATNRLGSSLSNGTRLNVREFKHDNNIAATGCGDKINGRMLESAKIAVCSGNWSGHVRRASNKLCAKGWKVCSVDNRHELNNLHWQEVKNITGCYAYNAASSTFYPCSTCKSRSKGSRMSGIGTGCASMDENVYSCLGQGRIDVHPKSSSKFSRKRLRSCAYEEGVTTGVACCKKRKISGKSPKRRKGKSSIAATCPCKNGGVCSRDRATCKCKKSYRGRFCQRRNLRRIHTRERRQRGIKCGSTKCLNKGVCYQGKCICPEQYTGESCELSQSTP